MAPGLEGTAAQRSPRPGRLHEHTSGLLRAAPPKLRWHHRQPRGARAVLRTKWRWHAPRRDAAVFLASLPPGRGSETSLLQRRGVRGRREGPPVGGETGPAGPGTRTPRRAAHVGTSWPGPLPPRGFLSFRRDDKVAPPQPHAGLPETRPTTASLPRADLGGPPISAATLSDQHPDLRAEHGARDFLWGGGTLCFGDR